MANHNKRRDIVTEWYNLMSKNTKNNILPSNGTSPKGQIDAKKVQCKRGRPLDMGGRRSQLYLQSKLCLGTRGFEKMNFPLQKAAAFCCCPLMVGGLPKQYFVCIAAGFKMWPVFWSRSLGSVNPFIRSTAKQWATWRVAPRDSQRRRSLGKVSNHRS